MTIHGDTEAPIGKHNVAMTFVLARVTEENSRVDNHIDLGGQILLVHRRN